MARTVHSSVTYYNAWDCSSCVTKGLNAYWCKQCPRCGSPKEPGDPYEAEYRTSTKVGKEYKWRGVDCTCDACGSENSARFSCLNCGKELDPKFRRLVRRFRATTNAGWRALKVAEGTPNATPAVQAEAASPFDAPPPPPPSDEVPPPTTAAVPMSAPWQASMGTPPSGTQLRLHFWLLLVALCVVGSWLYLTSQTRTAVTITATEARWSYSLAREQFRPQAKSETREADVPFTYPAAAYQRDSTRVFSHSEDIIKDVWTTDGCSRPFTDDIDNGDGTTTVVKGTETYDCNVATKVGERDIYTIEYTWTIDDWYDIEPLTASGTGQVPTFPVFEPIPGRLRAGGSPRETYTIVFAYGPDADTFTRTMPRATWEQFVIGAQYNALQDGFGRFVTIELIDPPTAFE